jgi:BlaI family penicillinase repressor
MARPTSRHPTELELQILKILWACGTPCSVRQVQQLLRDQGKDLAYTSVITMLNIMTRKRYLTRKKDRNATAGGGGYVYQPRISQQSTTARMLKDLVDRVFGGSAMDLVVQLLDQKDLDPHELKELRALIDRAATDEKRQAPPRKGGI